MFAMMRFSVMLFCLFKMVLSHESGEGDHPHVYEVEQGYERVTCGSTLKLAHAETDYRLHSQAVNYASGSGQRSVTAIPQPDDPESLWAIEGSGFNEPKCPRATPIKCNTKIRLRHLASDRYLHSHTFPSPISQQQEVSAFPAPGDAGDDWVVVCEEPGRDGKSDYWEREKKVALRHVDTGAWLSADGKLVYGRPIQGQLEVSASRNKADAKTEWIAKEGVYFAEEETNKTEL